MPPGLASSTATLQDAMTYDAASYHVVHVALSTSALSAAAASIRTGKQACKRVCLPLCHPCHERPAFCRAVWLQVLLPASSWAGRFSPPGVHGQSGCQGALPACIQSWLTCMADTLVRRGKLFAEVMPQPAEQSAPGSQPRSRQQAGRGRALGNTEPQAPGSGREPGKHERSRPLVASLMLRLTAAPRALTSQLMKADGHKHWVQMMVPAEQRFTSSLKDHTCSPCRLKAGAGQGGPVGNGQPGDEHRAPAAGGPAAKAQPSPSVCSP